MKVSVLFKTLIFVIISCTVKCGTLLDAKSLYTHITGNVNKYIRPENNQTEPTELILSFYIMSISSLDEVNGILTSTLSINIAWIDDSITWTPSSYGNIRETDMDSGLIWVPDLKLGNPAKKSSRIGLENTPLTIKSTGVVSHNVADVLETTCDVDVTYFPFDTQNCMIDLLVVGYTAKIKFRIGNNIDTTLYSENNLWILTSRTSEISDIGGHPMVRLILSLKRRYSFFILNLFSPVLIMVFLNMLVFILPPDCGERVGYAITCLLALSVYMTFASEHLPVSSKPIPIVTYVLLIFVIISSIICLEVIVGLKFHLQEEQSNPPLKLQKIFCFIQNGNRSVSVEPQFSEKDGSVLTVKVRDEDIRDRKYTITWKDIGRRFDKICFVTNLVSVALISVISINYASHEKV